MKKNLTELVFILDRSGSMAGLESDTIGGFNSLIDKQRTQEGECLVSTVLFDDQIEVLHDRVPLENVPKMTGEEYFVRGSTALIDALGGAIRHIGLVHKYARAEDVPEKTVFVITTDGMENASRRYKAGQVRQMVRHEQEKHGWEFLFIGANIDAVETANCYGIDACRAVNYRADRRGTAVVFNTVSDTVGALRKNCPLSEDWSAPIAEDYSDRR